jgi:hypothetical protein
MAKRVRLTAAIIAAALGVACLGSACTNAADGGLGQSCSYPSGSYLGTFVCNAGLVCNLGYTSAICEEPHTQAAGGRCSDRVNCQSNLSCDNYVCARVLTVGEACPPTPTGYGCADNLVCLVDSTMQPGHCVAAGAAGEPCHVDLTCNAGLICAKRFADGGIGNAHCDVAPDAGPNEDGADAAPLAYVDAPSD